MSESYEVIVVGGGPAGATAAAYLAMKGHRVLLLERYQFPREHIGESLLPSLMPVLRDFGLIDACREAGFVKKTGATFIWGKTREPWSFEFSETPFLPASIAFHVDRSKFDELVLNYAREQGVEVRYEAEVTDVVTEGERVVGVRYKSKRDETEQTVRAQFIVDASGAASVIGRRVTERRYDEQMRQTALYGYFNEVRGAPEERKYHVIIETCPKGWFWYIPVESETLGEISVGLVTGQEFKEEMKAKGTEAFFAEALADSPFVRDMLGPDAERVGDLRGIRDWSYTCDRTAGPGFYLAGDSAAFLDPLLSGGVSLAMLAGYSASVCIHTTLEKPEFEAAATDFYCNNYRQMYEVTRDFLHYFYAGNATAHQDDLFWKARKSLNLGENIGARQAFSFFVNTIPANPHPAIQKQIPMFHNFFDNIEHPLDEGEEGGQLRDFAESEQALQEATKLDDNARPEVNGTLESSFTIDAEGHCLQPIRGISFDRNRAVLSSTTSWLMGRNLAPLDDEACALLARMDGQTTWGSIVEQVARESGESVAMAREKAQATLERLIADRFVLVRASQSA